MGRKALLALVMFIFASYNSLSSFNTVNDFSFNSFGIINKPYFFSNLNKQNGGCNLTVEYLVVVQKARVRLSPSAFKPLKKVSKTLDFEAKGATCAGLVHCL